MIEVEGKKYRVVENLGVQAGYRAKVVFTPETPSMESVVVKRNGKWVWWTVADRLGQNEE